VQTPVLAPRKIIAHKHVEFKYSAKAIPLTKKQEHSKFALLKDKPSIGIDDTLISFAAISKNGKNEDRSSKPNQDNYFTLKNFVKKNVHLFGVVDGHGDYGKVISDYVKESLPLNIQLLEAKNKKTNKELALLNETTRKLLMIELFAKTQDDLTAKLNEKSSKSGATATLVFIIGRTLFCANVGDSRAILGTVSEGKTIEWNVTRISNDHKPDMQSELHRITEAKGKVAQCIDSNGKPYGPKRVWGKGFTKSGLAVSRSLGDIGGTKFGIISTPDVLEIELEVADKVVVVASDGVWEVLSNEEVIEIVKSYYGDKNAQGACEELVKTANKRWKHTHGYTDDITAIVIFLMIKE
jgi:serine/threonine protein phosphatase PrpC